MSDPPIRCKKCGKKSSFLLKCKCGNEYCSRDRLPEVHNCTEMEIFRKDSYELNKKAVLAPTIKEKVEWIT